MSDNGKKKGLKIHLLNYLLILQYISATVISECKNSKVAELRSI